MTEYSRRGNQSTTYDNEVTLIAYPITEDAIGQQIEGDPVETIILCYEKSIGYREFYAAAAEGIRPEIAVVIHRFEYSGQKVVRYNGVLYKVIRTYSTGTEEMELTLGEAQGV